MTNQLYNIQNKYSIHFIKNATILWSDNHSKEAKEKLVKLKKILEYEQSKINSNKSNLMI